MFFSLLLMSAGHVFADFILQLNRYAYLKRRYVLALVAHSLIWAIVLSLILNVLGLFLLWKLLFLFSTHFIIDWIKIRLFPAFLPILHPVNAVDQMLHFTTILVVLFVH